MQHTTSQSIEGKTVLITGAARRVGAHMARVLHAAGMNIVIHYRGSRSEAEALANEMQKSRANSVVLLQADLKDFDSLPRVIEEATAVWGRLDVLINNASTFYPTKVGELTEQHWFDLVDVNLKAPLFLAQAAVAELKKHHGCMINIIDIHADRPMRNYSTYCIAKAGLAMLTKAMAKDLGPEIRVNGIAPGVIMWPEAEENSATHEAILERVALKREGSPQDIATTALFLIRDAGYITGQIISVDGGRTLSN